MFNIFKKKREPEKVEETLIQRLARVEARLTRIEAEILDVATAQDIIRNKVLRKIQFKKEEESSKETENLNSSSVLVPL